jgi:hypothetical protein
MSLPKCIVIKGDALLLDVEASKQSAAVFNNFINDEKFDEKLNAIQQQQQAHEALSYFNEPVLFFREKLEKLLPTWQKIQHQQQQQNQHIPTRAIISGLQCPKLQYWMKAGDTFTGEFLKLTDEVELCSLPWEQLVIDLSVDEVI